MPKIPLTQAQRDANAAKLWESQFRAIVAYHRAFKRLAVKDIAARLGIPRSTMYEKLNDPRAFSLGEALRLMDVLDFTDSERGDLFGFAFDAQKAASS